MLQRVATTKIGSYFMGVSSMNAPITEEERQARREAVGYARGSVRLEGIVLSPAAEALAERYINGEISLEEHTRQGLVLCRKERAERENKA